MVNRPRTRELDCIRRLVTAGEISALNDRRLIERFVANKDEAVFVQLVRRHGPMVLGVCRRVLRNWHDAEDAFQATFLVLARKAASVRTEGSAAGWLFQVAYHLAMKMKANAERRRTRALPDIAGADTGDSKADWELRLILDEELSRLPEKYRTVLLLCHCEDKTRAEAARQLGWKEGAVKIRLERGRALLRARLTRRGIALSGLMVGSLLAQNATAAVSPFLVRDTVASATAFAFGKLSAAVLARTAVILANGALRTMIPNRLQFAVLLVLSVSVAFLAAGLGAYRALAHAPDPAAPRSPEVDHELKPKVQVKGAVVPPPDKKPEKPLRVLLFADGPTREYQFLRSVFAKEADRKRMELSVLLQSGGRGTVQDVPPDRLLKQFPARLDVPEKKEVAGDKSPNLAAYDVIIAFDPDWTKLTKEQGRLLDRWVRKEGGGLIIVAGPVHTLELARPVAVGVPDALKPIIDLLPVQLEDSRVAEELDKGKPWPLRFRDAEKLLKLDVQGKDPLAGWSEFFFDKQRDDWQQTDDQPMRGFYTAYPVKSVKRDAKVLATFRHPQARISGAEGMTQELPYLVTMQRGKGKTIYLGSGELWRLRQYNTDFYERLWSALARYAAKASPSP
jgi:RNA polymerase sigma factor (sigma-70 family)